MVRSCPPNAGRISRAAPVARECGFADTAAKIGAISLAGTASGCMRWLGGTTSEARADLPDVLAPEGAARDSAPTMMAAGCGAWDSVRRRSP